jgi:alpha-ketoglutarate-dependent taurine dioxygenase
MTDLEGSKGTVVVEGSKGVEVEGQQQRDGVVFPLGLSPTREDITLEDTISWFREHKEEIEGLLTQHAVIVFRGFPLHSPAHFDRLLAALPYLPFPYEGGNAPRHRVVGNVYTSTELPHMYPLLSHHEMAYRSTFPHKLFFFCEVPAQKDGETPICLSNVIYEDIAEHKKEFLAKVLEHGACYIKIFHDKNVPGAPNTSKSWQDAYETEDRAVVEAATTKMGNTFKWLPNGSFERHAIVKPAIREHPVTGKKAWFNNIHFSHPACWNTTKEFLTSYVTFGNGEEMDPEDAIYVNTQIFKNSVNLKWRAGDMAMVDNMAVLHGRNSYTPPRKVYLVMTH